MSELDALTADLAKIREARATGAKRIRYRDGREIEFPSVADLAALERDFERRIRELTQSPVSSIRFSSSKGLR